MVDSISDVVADHLVEDTVHTLDCGTDFCPGDVDDCFSMCCLQSKTQGHIGTTAASTFAKL